MGTFSVLKFDEDQRLVSGLAMVSQTADGKIVTDLQGDQITPDELEKAFIDYALESREGDVMHDGEPVSRLVEMFIVTTQKIDAIFKAFNYPVDLSEFKGVAAFVTYKVFCDEAWKRVKSGELKAFSIEAVGQREEATEEATKGWVTLEDGRRLLVGEGGAGMEAGTASNRGSGQAYSGGKESGKSQGQSVVQQDGAKAKDKLQRLVASTLRDADKAAQQGSHNFHAHALGVAAGLQSVLDSIGDD